MTKNSVRIAGFTLIEMSIVLIIIGLIVGGILVGQDLIGSAAVRAQIGQVQQYNSAMHAFQNKYGGLPGDLNVTLASQFGFNTTNCSGKVGGRDGNGLIDGYAGGLYSQTQGETGLFWQDLSSSGLISDTIPNSGGTAVTCAPGFHILSLTPGTAYVGDYFPTAKIGQGNFMYVYEDGGGSGGYNWFGLLAIVSTDSSGSLNPGILNTSLSVAQAYQIDKKIDDGLPTTGSVQDLAVRNIVWYEPVNFGYPDSPSTCYNTATNAYSTSISNGTNLNCALSFRFQ